MTGAVFVTGAGGFIGRALLPRLLASPERRIKALYRRPDSAVRSAAGPTMEIVAGDLLQPSGWRAALEGVETVIHLAAATGRAAPAEYERANFRATRKLLAACRAAGVRRFLYVSTIAAGYPDQSYYPYARTKARAEALVVSSGLDFAIVRPTLVLGADSPIWLTLRKIAGLPVIPLPRKGRPVSVQPVHVDDVVRGIAMLLDAGRFQGEVFELGGPDAMPFSAFLSDIHRAVTGKPARIVPVPLVPIRLLLALVEPVLRPLMPVTAGQLAVFANDSTAAPNWLLDRLRDGIATTEGTIARLTEMPPAGPAAPAARPPSRAPARALTDDAKRALEVECALFGRYLVGVSPNAYASRHYVEASARHGLAVDADLAPFDRAMLAVAREGRLLTRCADAYSAILHRGGALRRKLIVLAAILEHAAPTSELFDRPKGNGVAGALLGLLGHGAAFGLALIAGLMIFLPVRLLRSAGAGNAE